MAEEESFNFALGEDPFCSLQNVPVNSEASLFLLSGLSPARASDIRVAEVAAGQPRPRKLSVHATQLVLRAAKAFPIDGRLFLCGVGHATGDPRAPLFFVEEWAVGAAPAPRLLPHGDALVDLDFFDAEVLLLSARELLAFDVERRATRVRFSGGEGAPFVRVVTDRRHRRMYLARGSAVVALDEAGRQVAAMETGHALSLRCVDASAQRPLQLLTAAGDRSLRFWDLRRASAPNLVLHSDALLTAAAFHPLYAHLVLTGADDGALELRAAVEASAAPLLGGGGPAVAAHRLGALAAGVEAVAWSLQDAWLLAAAGPGRGLLARVPAAARLQLLH